MICCLNIWFRCYMPSEHKYKWFGCYTSSECLVWSDFALRYHVACASIRGRGPNIYRATIIGVYTKPNSSIFHLSKITACKIFKSVKCQSKTHFTKRLLQAFAQPVVLQQQKLYHYQIYLCSESRVINSKLYEINAIQQ